MEGLDDLFSLTDDTPFHPENSYDTRWKRLTARAVALVVLALAVHLPLLGGKMLWADEAARSQDVVARSVEGLKEVWLRPHLWQRPPLAETLFFLENRFAGEPVEMQAIGVLLHTANCLLLWLILRRLQIPGAWLVAAVLAVFPADVQALAWMAQQGRLWAALFGLSSLLLILKAAGIPKPVAVEVTLAPGTFIAEEKVNRWSIIRPLIGALFFYIAALLCQPGLFALPVMAIALVSWKRGISCVELKIGIPFFLLSIVCIVLGLASDVGVSHAATPHTGGPISQTLSTVLTTTDEAVHLSARALWPHPMITVFSGRPLSAHRAESYGALFGVGLVMLVALLLRRRIGLKPAMVIVCFVCLIPSVWDSRTAGPIAWLIPGRDASQYLVGLPLLVGLIAAMVWLISHLRSHLGIALARLAVGLAVLGSFATICWQSSGAYSSTESLWLAAIQGNPSDQTAHVALALWYLDQSRKDEAVEQIRGINNLDSCDDYQTLLAYGRVMQADGGRDADAIAAFRRAAELETADARAQSYLAAEYIKTGQKDLALACFEQAIADFPSDPDLRNDFGLLLSQQNQMAAAIGRFREAIALDGNFVPARLNLANALFSQGHLPEAAEELQTVVKIDPRNFDAFHNAGVMLCQLGDYARAQPMLDAAVRLKPESPEVRNDLGVALVATQNLADAKVQFNLALGMRPDYAAAKQNLEIVKRRLAASGAATRGSVPAD